MVASDLVITSACIHIRTRQVTRIEVNADPQIWAAGGRLVGLPMSLSDHTE